LSRKVRIFRIVALILLFIGFLVVGVLSHEAGHLTVNNFLGGTGEIYYNYTWTAGHMSWADLPPNYIWLVYLGGGICAAVFLTVFFWLAVWLTPTREDIHIEGAVAAPIITNFLYAPTELILYYLGAELFEWAWMTAYVLAAILFFILYTKILIKWIIRPLQKMAVIK